MPRRNTLLLRVRITKASWGRSATVMPQVRLWVLTPTLIMRAAGSSRSGNSIPVDSRTRRCNSCAASFTEGAAVQLLHIGPYAEETPTIERMRTFAAEKGFEFAGAHHEIYIGDPNRAKPETLKTGLRYPVRRAK